LHHSPTRPTAGKAETCKAGVRHAVGIAAAAALTGGYRLAFLIAYAEVV
jgi:hypothetical protein